MDSLPDSADRHALTEVLTAGLVTLDVTQTVDRVPGPNEKVVARSVTVAYGGPAANASGVARALGARAALVTNLGQGGVADLARHGLGVDGIEVFDVRPQMVDGCPVSTVLVQAHDGERAVISTNVTRVRADRRLVPTTVLAGAQACLVDGHDMELCIEVAGAARGAGIPVVFDGGSWKDGTQRLLPLCDVVIVSADFHLPDGAPGPGVLDELLGQGCRFVARSDGPAPLRAATGDRRFSVPVPSVQPVADTVGAGDVLHGAAAWAVAEVGLTEATFEPVLRFATTVASISCGHPGARGFVDEPRAMAAVAEAQRRLFETAR